MARTCYAMLIKVKNPDEKKDKAKMISKEAFEIRSGEEISLDPKDSVESVGTIELDDEVKEFIMDEGRKLNIENALSGKSREDLIPFLVKNIDVFAWSASDNGSVVLVLRDSVQSVSKSRSCSRRGLFEKSHVRLGVRPFFARSAPP
jgi:hypothetical protein